MADNIQLNTPSTSGKTLRSLEDQDSLHYPVGVTAFATTVGTPDVLTIVTPTTGLPVRLTDGSGYIATLPVSVATTLTVTGAGGTFPVTDSGGSLTVDAPVGTPVFVRLSDGSAAVSTLPVSATSLPLPSGAATAANQSTANTHLATLAGAVSGTAVQVDVLTMPTVTVTALNLDVRDLTSGTDSVAAVQSGAWSVTSVGGAAHDAAAIGNPVLIAGYASAAAPSDVSADGDAVRLWADRAGRLQVGDGGGSLTVDGTFWQATQPVSVAATVTVTGAGGTFPVTDSGGSLTVDNGGTFAVQTGAEHAEDVAHSSGHTGLFVLSVRADAAASTAGSDGDYAGLTTDATGRLWCNVSNTVAVSGTFWQATQPVSVAEAVAITDNAGSLTVDAPVGTPVFVRLSDGSSAISTLPVSLASVPSHAVTNAGTFAVQIDGAALTALQLVDDVVATTGSAVPAKGFAAAGTDGTNARLLKTDSSGELQVDVLTLPTLATVTTVTTVSSVTALTGGGVAHDGADSGNPVKVGTRTALTLSDDTMVANGDRADAVSDGDGALVTRPQFPLGDLLSERVSNTDGNSTAFSTFGATANTRNVVTAVVVVNTSTSNGYVDFRDGTGGSVLFSVPIPANGGVVLPAGATPYFRTTSNTALAYDVSAALTTVYVSVSGFKSKVV